MQLPTGKYRLALQDDQGNTLNRRDVTPGHSELEVLTFITELHRFKDGWEGSKAVNGHLKVVAIAL